MTEQAHPMVEHARADDAGDESRKREPLDRETLSDAGQTRTDQDEVAGHVRGKQAEQRDEAERVDIAGDRREKHVLATHAVRRGSSARGYLLRRHDPASWNMSTAPAMAARDEIR